MKVYALACGVLVLLILGYYLSFGKTLALYADNSSLLQLTEKGEQGLLKEIQQLADQKHQIDSMKQVVASYSSSTEIFTDIIQKAKSYRLKVVQISEGGTEFNGEIHCTFSGLYVNMIKLIRVLETDFKSIKLETIEFDKIVDRRTGNEFLYVKLVLKRNEFDI